MKLWAQKKNLVVAAAIGLACLAGSPTSYASPQSELNDELIMAVAWMQNSAEYRELCYQAYNIALERVETAVKNHKAGDKPLAIVLDADETVIDNSAVEAGLVGTDNAYNSKDWNEWCNAAVALAMPGAAEYLQAVDKLGVEIFYVSNRKLSQVPATAKNFKALGFPQADAKHMIFKDDTGNKMPRFARVMADYDVVVFMGDNAGDLPIGTYGKGQTDRNALVDAHRAEFGRRFIALPNPSYGDWEAALQPEWRSGSYWSLTPAEKKEVREKSLRKWQPTAENNANK